MRIRVYPSRLFGEVEAPPSKSYTHRAYAAALLADGESILINPLRSRDTEATKNACTLLGAGVREEGRRVLVRGGAFKTPDDVIDVGNSGTTLRFFTAISALAPKGYAILTGDESIRRRPMKPLLEALRSLGVWCRSSRLDGRAPIIVRCGGVDGGEARITGGISSQFISALLYASVRSRRGARIIVDGEPVSRPYIDASLEVLRRFGFRVRREGYALFEVEGCQVGEPCEFRIPGDFGSAAFLLAGGQLTGGEVIVKSLDRSLPQADSAIIEVLRGISCDVEVSGDRVRVRGSGGGCGGEYDLRDSPDLLPVLAVLASRSRGETVIRGVGHARFKESDRIMCVASELRKLGIEVEVLEDGLRIRGRGRIEGGCLLNPHGDHRLFMAFTILAASTERGCLVDGAETAAISYPQFLDHVRRLGLRFEEV